MSSWFQFVWNVSDDVMMMSCCEAGGRIRMFSRVIGHIFVFSIIRGSLLWLPSLFQRKMILFSFPLKFELMNVCALCGMWQKHFVRWLQVDALQQNQRFVSENKNVWLKFHWLPVKPGLIYWYIRIDHHCVHTAQCYWCCRRLWDIISNVQTSFYLQTQRGP